MTMGNHADNVLTERMNEYYLCFVEALGLFPGGSITIGNIPSRLYMVFNPVRSATKFHVLGHPAYGSIAMGNAPKLSHNNTMCADWADIIPGLSDSVKTCNTCPEGNNPIGTETPMVNFRDASPM